MLLSFLIELYVPHKICMLIKKKYNTYCRAVITWRKLFSQYISNHQIHCTKILCFETICDYYVHPTHVLCQFYVIPFVLHQYFASPHIIQTQISSDNVTYQPSEDQASYHGLACGWHRRQMKTCLWMRSSKWYDLTLSPVTNFSMLKSLFKVFP